MTEALTKKVDGLELINEHCAAIEKIDAIIKDGQEAVKMQSGIVRTLKIANFVARMNAALTPEVMQSIMFLQGRSIGFKTDRDDKGGYDVNTVRDVAIAAAAINLTMTNNEVNIISGQMYPTKVGCGKILNTLGVRHFETPHTPEFHSEKTMRTKNGDITHVYYKCAVTVEYYDNGEKQMDEVSFLIKFNNGMSMDAIAGKAVRKARHYLIEKITGLEINDGDVDEDVDRIKDVTPKPTKRALFKSDSQNRAESPSNAKTDENHTNTQGETQNATDAKETAKETMIDDTSALQSELTANNVTDVTAEDIKKACNETANKYEQQFVIKNLMGYVKWVRDMRNAQKSQTEGK